MTELEKLLNLSADKMHFLQSFHLDAVSIEIDHVKISAQVQEEVCNNYGFAHGGFLMTLSDVAAGLTSFTDGRNYVTQSSNFQFLGNVQSGTVIAEGTVLHRGKTVTSVRVEVTDENGKLLCESLFSMFCVQKKFPTTESPK